MMRYDALLLLSYGSPETREDVIPFLENLFRGKEISQQVLRNAADQYDQLAMYSGNFSPLGQQCRDLISGLLQHRTELLSDPGVEFPISGELSRGLENLSIYWGNLYWYPLLQDTIREMFEDGIRKVLVFITSPFDSWFSRGRYVEALEGIDREGLEMDVIPPYGEDPKFLRAVVDRLLEASAHLQLELEYSLSTAGTRVLFTAHSLPLSDPLHETYKSSLRRSASKIMDRIGRDPFPRIINSEDHELFLRSAPIGSGLLDSSGSSYEAPLRWEVVFQSRSGSPQIPWLEPDLGTRIRELLAERDSSGTPLALILVPLGFLLENKETSYDLDLKIVQPCEQMQVPVVRAATPALSREIVEMVFEQVIK